jgi:hypothetical protein
MKAVVSWKVALPLALLTLLACEAKDPSGDSPHATTSPAELVVDEGCPHRDGSSCGEATAKPAGQNKQAYGDPLGESPRISLTELLQAPDDFHQKSVTVSGHVRRACSKKGCWMEVATSDQRDAPGCRVTFKDYGFLVPTDSAGSQATMEAVVQLTEVNPDAVRHYEQEGATFPTKRADGTAVEERLVATGVEHERI